MKFLNKKLHRICVSGASLLYGSGNEPQKKEVSSPDPNASDGSASEKTNETSDKNTLLQENTPPQENADNPSVNQSELLNKDSDESSDLYKQNSVEKSVLLNQNSGENQTETSAENKDGGYLKTNSLDDSDFKKHRKEATNDNSNLQHQDSNLLRRQQWKYQDLFPKSQPNDNIQDETDYQSGRHPETFYRRIYKAQTSSNNTKDIREDIRPQKDFKVPSKHVAVSSFEPIHQTRGTRLNASSVFSKGKVHGKSVGNRNIDNAVNHLQPQGRAHDAVAVSTQRKLLDDLRWYYSRTPLVESRVIDHPKYVRKVFSKFKDYKYAVQ